MYQIIPVQQRILDFIKSEIEDKGYPPTIREIQIEVGYNSPSSVHWHLNDLEKRGYIQRAKRSPRALKVMEG